MQITFVPLAKSHFGLLLKWLETPHVKTWWDPDIVWTSASVKEKYANYIKEHKVIDGVVKAIQAYIICVDSWPIGYIQIYNAYDFPRDTILLGLPKNLAAFDILIGEIDYLNRGVGAQVLIAFLQKYAASYTHVFADPEKTNYAAIRAYEKAGFEKAHLQPNNKNVWMIKNQR